MPPLDQLPDSVVIWKGLYYNTMEYCRFSAGQEPSIAGTIVGEAKGIPVHLTYAIRLDENYRVQEATVQPFGKNGATLHLIKKDNLWYRDGVLHKAFSGCDDIDIAETPATNTLPIQRLRLAKGGSAIFNVVYIDPLAGEVKVVEQKYTRLDDCLYFYENPSTAFQSEIVVDEYGVVKEYPGIWTSILPQRTSK